MKRVDEIIAEIEETLEKLDMIIEEWAKEKAAKSYSDEMKKVTLNVCKSASNSKTNAGKEREAYNSEDYKKYLWKAFEVDVRFYQLDGRKTTLEKKIDALRSLLSYNKQFQENTI